MTSDDEQIGAQIREFRKALDLNQTELADRMTELGHPMQQQTILKIEKGVRSLKMSEASAMASCLRKNVRDLVPDDDEQQNISELMFIAREVRERGFKGCEELFEAELLSKALKEVIDGLPESLRRRVPDYALESAGMNAEDIAKRHLWVIRDIAKGRAEVAAEEQDQ